MQTSEEEQCRMPLAEDVTDCAKRWFQDIIKEAKAVDSSMQLLVGQMNNSGYCVPRNPGKNETEHRELFGLAKPQKVEIQSGKQAVNIQVSELVSQIQRNRGTKLI